MSTRWLLIDDCISYSRQHRRCSRRALLRRAGALSAAALAGAALTQPILSKHAAAAGGPAATPLRHIVVACQENRSFDHYFGRYPRAGSFGPPPGYALPDGMGGTITPYHLQSTITGDVSHSWVDTHREWDGGKMDGFYVADGRTALGYYDARDLAYYYALADHFTLCGRFFCSLLGPTSPNRVYLLAGTAGGATTDSIASGSLRFPTILDLLDAAGISWKIYNGLFAQASGFNPAAYFARRQSDPRANAAESAYFTDLQRGTLPQVSFIAPNALDSEHPPASISWGQRYIQDRVAALMASTAWPHAAFILTYDEAGGFFDHVAPPRIDAFGPGVRVPALIVSPYAKRGYVAPTIYDHSSILKLIEAVFGLPTLASVNHQFDHHTPGGLDHEAADGAAHGPPAPPRDGSAMTGNLLEAFDFSQDPRYAPRLPAVSAAHPRTGQAAFPS